MLCQIPSDCSEHPHVEEQEEDSEEETQPNPPADTGTVSHAKHAVHSPAQPDARIIEGIIEFCHMGRITDLVSNGKRYLSLSVSVGSGLTLSLHL